MTREEARARWICCPMCDKKKCKREADDCDINNFRKYQKEWLTSHNDIEFDRPEEDLILAFLDDTANCYISEHTSGPQKVRIRNDR